MKKLIILLVVSMSSFCFSATNFNRAELFYYNIGAAEAALGSATGSFDNNVSAGMLNPAGIATVQQLKFSTMFGDLAGNSTYFYLGSAIPTTRGILGASFRYFGADADTSVDRAVGGSLSWAKKFTDNLFIGLGMKYFQLQYDAKSNSNPQIGLDFGGIYKKNLDVNEKKSYNFKNYAIGASVLNIGNYLKNADTNVITTPFQIKVGPSARMSLTPDLDLGVSADLILVNFVKFKFNVGIETEFLRQYSLNFGYLFNSDLNWFGLGAAYKFTIKNLEGKASFTVLPTLDKKVMLFAGVDAAIGTIDKTPPKVDFGFEENKDSDFIFISPNYDGAQDMVTINMNIKDNTQLRDWKVEIMNDKQQAVKTFTSPDISTWQGKLTVGKVLTKMFEKRKEVPVPQKIIWDGKDQNGLPLTDGEYKIVITARDENLNVIKTPTKNIVIDTVAPKAEIKSDLMLFSPNGDGAKDVVTFFNDATGDDTWNAEIKDSSGKTVRKYDWKDKTPDGKIVWDGTDETGKEVAEGVYSYHLSGIDKAGNAVEKKLANISLSRQKDAAEIDADMNVFSPNLDGKFDKVTFTPTLSSVDGLQKWELRIMDENKNVVASVKGANKLTSKMAWDGTDNDGKILKDGNYFYQFNAEYANGNHPETFIKGIVVDSSAPKTDIVLNTSVFSPDGDGKNDIVQFIIKVKDDNDMDSWKLEISDEKNVVVKSFSGKGSPAAQISWSGLKDDGSLVKGGEVYNAVFTVADIVANRFTSGKMMIQVDAAPPAAAVSVKHRIFSPDNDGDADLQEIKFSRFDKKKLKGWTLKINLYDLSSKSEIPFKTYSGTNLPESISWDGKGDDGSLVKGGQIYKVNFLIEDILSNKTNLRDQCAIDSTPPDVDLKLGIPSFSPDNDGEADLAIIGIVQRDKKAISGWKIEIFPIRDASRGSLFRTFNGTVLPSKPLEWDGRDDSGKELVESAMDYEVVLTATDVLGNTTEIRDIQSVDILVIKTPYGYQIKISTIGFARDSAVLEGAQNGKILNKVAKILSKYRSYKVEIQGHASKDSAQSGDEYNLALSENRAKSVLVYLTKQGLSEDQFKAVGRGFNVPVASNDTEEDRAKNRRVEFWLYKDGWPNP